ncbi:MAG: hypothetical protein SFY67_16655 [Candidatus Melainabacteria bacterium]|nr:hypothetical protein [Candidatus Melainabacteria bacterium]
MSLESDAAEPRGTQQDNQAEGVRLASLNFSATDYSAFSISTQSFNSPTNFMAPQGFNPYERPTVNQPGFNQPGFIQPCFNQQVFAPQQRFDQTFGYPPQMQRDPWQQYRMEALPPNQNYFPQGRNDFWGNYWSAYFREADRRGYRPPQPQDYPTQPNQRRPRYEGPDAPPNNEPYQSTGTRNPMEPVTDASIVNDISKRRNGERVDPVYVGIDNRESYKGPDGKKHIRNAPAWLDRPAAQAYLMINEELAPLGKKLLPASHCADCANINSLGRTNTQQAIASGLRAAPGNSEHERGAALDVKNFNDPDVARLLRKYGFVQGNLSRPNVPIPNDAHHFSFDIRNASKIAQMWDQSTARTRFAKFENAPNNRPNNRPVMEAENQPEYQPQYMPQDRIPRRMRS